jgi:hypothetical protein
MNDLSDEAFWECTDGMTRLQAWQECRRRAEETIKDRERNAFYAGWQMRIGGIEMQAWAFPNPGETHCDAAYRVFLERRTE